MRHPPTCRFFNVGIDLNAWRTNASAGIRRSPPAGWRSDRTSKVSTHSAAVIAGAAVASTPCGAGFRQGVDAGLRRPVEGRWRPAKTNKAFTKPSCRSIVFWSPCPIRRVGNESIRFFGRPICKSRKRPPEPFGRPGWRMTAISQLTGTATPAPVPARSGLNTFLRVDWRCRKPLRPKRLGKFAVSDSKAGLVKCA